MGVDLALLNEFWIVLTRALFHNGLALVGLPCIKVAPFETIGEMALRAYSRRLWPPPRRRSLWFCPRDLAAQPLPLIPI